MGRRMLNNRDFTLDKYVALCKAVKNSKYKIITFKEYIEMKDKNNGFIIIRHDVDENIRFSLDMAKVEFDNDVKATYYFRTIKKVYVPDIIDKIASFNHEIGYHYETLDKAKGNIELAIELFSEELAVFRQRYIIKTVCMHGNPLSKYDNKKIWGKSKFSDFDLLGESYLSLDYNKFAYFSDSGRTWNADKNKIKDYVNTMNFKLVKVENTDELIKVINNGCLENICILTHPERWSKNSADYLTRYLIDLYYNMGKKVIKSFRGTQKK